MMGVFGFREIILFTLLPLIFSTVPQVRICTFSEDDATCPYVSRIGLGTLHLGDSISGLSNVTEINSWIVNAVSVGITLFDLADVYPVKGGTSGASATLFGQALALTPGLREQIQIVAKMDIVFPSTIDTSDDHLQKTLDWFLSVLGTTYIDFLLLHYPNSFMNADQVAKIFAQFKAEGSVKHFGTSNHFPSHRNLLQTKLDKYGIKLVTNEIETSVWNPSYMNYNSDLVDDAYTQGYRILGWGALGGDPLGGLNRLFDRHGTRQFRIKAALEEVGEAFGTKDTAVTALAWLLSHPSGIIPLLGTTRIDRVNSLASAALGMADKFATEQSNWWKIGGAGGLCPLGDSQCNYAEYSPGLPGPE